MEGACIAAANHDFPVNRVGSFIAKMTTSQRLDPPRCKKSNTLVVVDVDERRWAAVVARLTTKSLISLFVEDATFESRPNFAPDFAPERWAKFKRHFAQSFVRNIVRLPSRVIKFDNIN